MLLLLISSSSTSPSVVLSSAVLAWSSISRSSPTVMSSGNCAILAANSSEVRTPPSAAETLDFPAEASKSGMLSSSSNSSAAGGSHSTDEADDAVERRDPDGDDEPMDELAGADEADTVAGTEPSLLSSQSSTSSRSSGNVAAASRRPADGDRSGVDDWLSDASVCRRGAGEADGGDTPSSAVTTLADEAASVVLPLLPDKGDGLGEGRDDVLPGELAIDGGVALTAVLADAAPAVAGTAATHRP